MKFQDSSCKDLKVTVGTKNVTHPSTHAGSKAICPINFFKVGGIINKQKPIMVVWAVGCPVCMQVVPISAVTFICGHFSLFR